MTYEVLHGEKTHYVQAGNQYAACLDVLRAEAEADEIPLGPFCVTPLPEGETEEIPFNLVLRLKYMAVNGEPVREETKVDLTRW